MPIVYRVIREKFRGDALSAEGSRLYGARWNPKGTGILYTTSSPELGLVETLAHAPGVRYKDLPVYWLSSIEIPDTTAPKKCLLSGRIKIMKEHSTG